MKALRQLSPAQRVAVASAIVVCLFALGGTITIWRFAASANDYEHVMTRQEDRAAVEGILGAVWRVEGAGNAYAMVPTDANRKELDAAVTDLRGALPRFRPDDSEQRDLYAAVKSDAAQLLDSVSSLNGSAAVANEPATAAAEKVEQLSALVSHEAEDRAKAAR